MKKFILILFASFTAFFARAEVYSPQDVPDPKEKGQAFYVADPDNLLADSTVNWINACAEDLDEKTHVELAVVALSSIGNYDAFDFAYELFQRWGIGRKGQNTGVLILFALESHDLRIMTGTGIEGVLTDAKCSAIMHDEMFPAFRAEDYDAGLCLGVLAIYETCTNGEAPEELLTISSVTNRGKYAAEEDEWTTSEKITLLCMGLFGLLIFIAIYFSAVKKCPACGKRKARAIHRHTLVAATYAHAGKEQVTYRCKNCGHEFELTQILPKLTRSSSSGGSSWSGGGSSGGGSWGGGSTSGGGAGGKW